MPKETTLLKFGTKFGNITVLAEGRIKQRDKVLCRCFCGNEFNTQLLVILHHRTKSCGCLKGFCKKSGKYSRTINVPFGYKRKWSAYKYASSRKNRIWELTSEQFIKLIDGKCTYCGSDGGGIDRQDSKIGYIYSNCVSCCGICNMMKKTYSIEEFLIHVEKIMENNSLK